MCSGDHALLPAGQEFNNAVFRGERLFAIVALQVKQCQEFGTIGAGAPGELVAVDLEGVPNVLSVSWICEIKVQGSGVSSLKTDAVTIL
jgi:hypothetical protein